MANSKTKGFVHHSPEKISVREAESYLLLGSNVGNRYQHLQSALRLLRSLGKIIRKSHIYLTKSWGEKSQRDHYNQAIHLSTNLPPNDLMHALLKIENQLGRERIHTYGPRTIDVDILLYDQELHQTDFLTLPHPQLHLRNFALIPLMELAAELAHPRYGKTIEELYFECEDSLDVLMLENDG